MINPKQPRRIVEKQLKTAEAYLAQKQRALAATNSKPHQTRFQREIETLERRIAEYRAYLVTKEK